MRVLLLAGALFLAAITTNTFANDVTATHAVRRSFAQNFPEADNVQWSMIEQLYRADFNVDGEKRSAFFSANDGTLVATSRYMVAAQLPRALQNSLKSYTASFTLIEVFEVQHDDGADYYATVQKTGETLILKAAASKWDVYKKK